MNELVEKINIKTMIYEIRGKQVMLASDVAKLYNTDVRSVNQVVKRNINRFPEDFCFQLTDEEYNGLRSQFVISNENTKGKYQRGGNRYLPYVFTEHGIMMLSGLLKSEVAVKVNVMIIQAFVEMRKYISSMNYENRISNIETKLIDHDNKFEFLFDSLENKVNEHIFFDGQIYDAYSLMIDIFNTSKKNITIIDNYVDKNILDILSRTKKEVLLITNQYNNSDYNKYKSQYSNVTIKINNNIHDRFIIIDNEVLYHCGASFKDLGNKCFTLNKIEDINILKQLDIYIR